MRLVRDQNWNTTLDQCPFAFFGLPFSKTGDDYYGAVFAAGLASHSFGFADDAGLCAVIKCDNSDRERLTRYKFPIEIWAADRLGAPACNELISHILGELSTLSRSQGMTGYTIRTWGESCFVRMLAGRLLAGGTVPILALDAVLDLANDDATLFALMRSGHRRHVRWGEKSLSLLFVDQDNPDKALFESYQQLHAEIAGRVTRPQASWDAMFALIAGGKGDLAISHFEGNMIGGTLVLDDGQAAYYASGANRRDQFDKPLAHFPLYKLATRARARGNHHFVVGEVGQFEAAASDKERSIGQFKSGFSSETRASLIWTVAVAPV